MTADASSSVTVELSGLSPTEPTDVHVSTGMPSNSPPAEPTPAEITQIEGTLRKLFGYSQFQLIGQATKTLKTGEEDWLAASKYFSLQVDSRGEKADAYVLNLKLFQEQKLLLETKAKLSKASPLVIRGPQVGDGQLVIVLVVQ